MRRRHKRHDALQTCLLRCVECGEWVSELTQPHSAYVCQECAEQGHGTQQRLRQLIHDRDVLRRERAHLEGQQ
jgi:hypothetical protein